MTLGLREALIGLIGLVALYILFVLLRMLHLRKPAAAVPESATDEAPPARAEAADEPPSAPAGEAESAALRDWEAVPVGLADEVLRRGLEQELAQLREEVDAMRGELAALRSDMHQELASLRASQAVSPIYGDAMQLGCNVVALGNDSVLVPASSKRLIEKCRAEGLTVYDPDVSMIGAGGGAVHCMCQALRRESVG